MLFCDGGWRWRRDGGGRGVPVGPPAGSTSPDRRRRGRWNRPPGARQAATRRYTITAAAAAAAAGHYWLSVRGIGEPAHTGARRRRSAAPLARDLDSLVAAAGRAPAASRQL